MHPCHPRAALKRLILNRLNSLSNYLEENKLFSAHQSGYSCNDSCVSQLIAIFHEIYTAFDANPTLETSGVFLKMSDAFDKVWHTGLINKLESMGVYGDLLKLIKHFLNDRFSEF